VAEDIMSEAIMSEATVAGMAVVMAVTMAVIIAVTVNAVNYAVLVFQ